MIVRLIIYRGKPEAIAEQLARSMADGSKSFAESCTITTLTLYGGFFTRLRLVLRALFWSNHVQEARVRQVIERLQTERELNQKAQAAQTEAKFPPLGNPRGGGLPSAGQAIPTTPGSSKFSRP